MSGILVNGKFLESTDFICKICNAPVLESSNIKYAWTCLSCKREFGFNDVYEQSPYFHPSVCIAFFDGHNFNYVLDAGDEPLVFENQFFAECYLISAGISCECVEDFYFIEQEK